MNNILIHCFFKRCVRQLADVFVAKEYFRLNILVSFFFYLLSVGLFQSVGINIQKNYLQLIKSYAIFITIHKSVLTFLPGQFNHAVTINITFYPNPFN